MKPQIIEMSIDIWKRKKASKEENRKAEKAKEEKKNENQNIEKKP